MPAVQPRQLLIDPHSEPSRKQEREYVGDADALKIARFTQKIDDSRAGRPQLRAASLTFIGSPPVVGQGSDVFLEAEVAAGIAEVLGGCLLRLGLSGIGSLWLVPT